MARTYRKSQRAEDEARTRLKIVEAAVALHQRKGVAATSMSDIAAEAGVGRVTVYRHFPDETAMVAACSGHYLSEHVLPDAEAWRTIADPRDRLFRGLTDAYAYHRETEAMMAKVLPDLRGSPLIAPYYAHWRRAAEILAEAWPSDSHVLRAALVLALDFDTWVLLTRGQGLTDAESVDLMERMIAAV